MEDRSNIGTFVKSRQIALFFTSGRHRDFLNNYMKYFIKYRGQYRYQYRALYRYAYRYLYRDKLMIRYMNISCLKMNIFEYSKWRILNRFRISRFLRFSRFKTNFSRSCWQMSEIWVHAKSAGYEERFCSNSLRQWS